MELRQAIHEAALEAGLIEEGEMMVGFVVVSAWEKFGDEGGICTYVHQVDSGMKTHEGVGLLQMGMDNIIKDEFPEDD
jgi:hypothetical protein